MKLNGGEELNENIEWSIQKVKGGVTTLMTWTDMETAELFASYFEDVLTADDSSHMP